MMERYSLREAQDHLQELIAEALRGKTVVITDDEAQAVQLVPVPATQKLRQAGSARGLVKIAADFDAPLADFDAYIAQMGQMSA